MNPQGDNVGFFTCSATMGTPVFCFVLFVFLGPHLHHMEVPRLGVESELQLPAYTTAIATPDPSHVCDLHHSSQQCRILNPLSKARDQPTSSWILVRFFSTEPQRELLFLIFDACLGEYLPLVEYVWGAMRFMNLDIQGSSSFEKFSAIVT